MGMTQNRTTIQILKSITLPLFAKLRSVKWHFLSFVFKFFVPKLFLSLNSSNKPYCISVCYIQSVVYQEEDNDGCLLISICISLNFLLQNVFYKIGSLAKRPPIFVFLHFCIFAFRF